MRYQPDLPSSIDEELEEEQQQWAEEQRYAELQALQQGQDWCADPPEFDDFLSDEIVLDGEEDEEIIPLSPSQFTKFAFRMPKDDGTGYAPFNFEGRRHMLRVYDTSAPRVLLCCARQCEKSTALGNKTIAYSCMLQAYASMYVAPTSTQAKTFGHDRIEEAIETSPILKRFTSRMLKRNTFEKQFVNRSTISLRYAFLNADRTRGQKINRIVIDELQDHLAANIPIIEMAASHAPEPLRRFEYGGTPKSLDNTIEYYWGGFAKGRAMSTQGQWVVPCDRCGSDAEGAAGRHWNILGERNIGLKGLICDKCGELIFAQHPDAQWAHMNRDGIFESYRVPQLMVPWRSWDEILLDYRRFPIHQFYNEVLGISYDSGLRPIQLDHIRNCCNEQVQMDEESLNAYQRASLSRPVFAGLDHGGGGSNGTSYTVLTLGCYVDQKFRIFYIHRFDGIEQEPEYMMKLVMERCQQFNVRIIGSDWGGGLIQNNQLTKKFGRKRVQQFFYSSRPKEKVAWKPKMLCWVVHRSVLMAAVFTAIRAKHLEFPAWGEFRVPYATDIMNIRAEYNESLRLTQYTHLPDRPDDSFHSILYCFLASMIMFPRPDIIAPSLELPSMGAQWGTAFGGQSAEYADQG